jgi:2-oxoglutarate dehydrogenase E2 component (dihydrolipoamide succinyltransferase)
MHGGAKLLRAFLIALVAVGLPACHADEDTQAVSSSTQVSEAPDATSATPDPAPAAPDPAPAAPDPAPAPPAPDPAPAAPVPDPATQEDPTLPLSGAPAAEEPVTPVGAACADVLEALTDAVIRYEMTALAEASGSGSRSAAAADMLALIERARAAAYSQAGVPSAAAPAINSVIALRAGLDTLATLDGDDAAPWRGPRDDLQAWCSAQG